MKMVCAGFIGSGRTEVSVLRTSPMKTRDTELAESLMVYGTSLRIFSKVCDYLCFSPLLRFVEASERLGNHR